MTRHWGAAVATAGAGSWSRCRSPCAALRHRPAQGAAFTLVGSIPRPGGSGRGARQARLRRRWQDAAHRRHRESGRRRKRTRQLHVPGERSGAFEVVGSLVYVAADFFGFGILDVSNPAAPKLRGSLQDARARPRTSRSSVRRPRSPITCRASTSSTSRMPTSRSLLESFYVEGYAREVAASGSMAYAVDAPTGSIRLDMAKPGAPEPVSAQQTATAPGRSSCRTPDARRQAEAGSARRRRDVQVYDLTKPTAPVRTEPMKTPSGRAPRATLHGARAYVADAAKGLQVVDLSKPKTLRACRIVQDHRAGARRGGHRLACIPGRRRAAETPREFKDQEVLILKHSF